VQRKTMGDDCDQTTGRHLLPAGPVLEVTAPNAGGPPTSSAKTVESRLNEDLSLGPELQLQKHSSQTFKDTTMQKPILKTNKAHCAPVLLER